MSRVSKDCKRRGDVDNERSNTHQRLVILALPSSSLDLQTMESKVLVRDNKKFAVQKAKSDGAGALVDSDDSMTLMDVIRTVKRPTQQQKRPAQLAAQAEEVDYHVKATADLSSGSEEDLGTVCKYYKRKRKCKDLNDILKREPLVSGLKSDRQDDSPELSKAKKSESSNEKSHNAPSEEPGRRKVSTQSSPPSVPRILERRAGPPINHQTDDTREMMETLKSLSDSLGLGKLAIDDQALDGSYAQVCYVGNQQKPRASALKRPRSPYVKAARKARSLSQLHWFGTSESEAALLPISGSGLHTCADAKNCQNACVARAVAPNLDHMSEAELIYWYEEVTRKKFTSRSGEKVRGRIRRAIRAEVKRASALDNSDISTFDEAGRSDSTPLEPRTPSPGKLVNDIHPADSLLCEFSAPVGAREGLACAFNSAASFDEFVDREITKKSSVFNEVRPDSVSPHKPEELLECGSNPEEVGFVKECEPVGSMLAKDEVSIVDSVEALNVPTDFASVVSLGPETFSEWEMKYGEAPSSCEKRTPTFLGERCIGNVEGSQTQERQCLLPSADSALRDVAPLGIGPSRSLIAEVREDFGSVPSIDAMEENGSSGHQPSEDGISHSADRDLKSGAAEISQSTQGIEGSKQILLECQLGEDSSQKLGPGAFIFSCGGGERSLFIPDVRPSFPSREQWSPSFQDGMPSQACDTRTRTSRGHVDPDYSSETSPYALEAAEEREPNSAHSAMSIKDSGNSPVPVTKHDEERGEPEAKGSSQFEPQATIGETPADGLTRSQQIARVLPSLHERVTEPTEEIPMDSETTEQEDVGSNSESADVLNPLVLFETSGHSRQVEVAAQDKSQLTCVGVAEHDRVGMLSEVCETSLDDLCHLPGSTHGVCDTSRLENPCQSVNNIDGSAETCSTAKEVKGILMEGLPTCRRSAIPSDIPGDEMRVCDTDNVSILPIPPDATATEDRVLSLEEYIAVHRGEDGASPQEQVEDLEEDDASQPMETQDVSREARGGDTEQGLVDELATEQMVKDVACRQLSAVDDYPVEETSGPNEGDLGEDVPVPKMKDMDVPQHGSEGKTHVFDEELSSQRTAEDVTSELLQCEVVSKVREEDGAAEPKVKRILSYHSPEDGTAYDLGEEPVSLEDSEQDIATPKMLICANQKSGDSESEVVAVRDPDEDVFSKAMAEVVSEESNADGTATEVDEALATQEVMGVVLASQLPPIEDSLIRSDTEEHIAPQDSEKDESAQCVEEVGVPQKMIDGTAQELKEEFPPHQLDNDITLEEYDLPPARECDAENQTKQNVGSRQVAGEGSPNSEEDIPARQMRDAALQSLEDDVAADPNAGISESCLPSPGPTQLPREVVCSQRLDSVGAISPPNLEEDDAAERIEDDVGGMRKAQGGVEESCDCPIASVGDVNDVAKDNDSSEKTGEESPDFPVVLSQPRGRRAQEERIAYTVNDVQGRPQPTSSLSRRMTRASLELEKSIRAVEEELVSSSKSSSQQSRALETVLSDRHFNCANDCDPLASERRGTPVLEQPLPLAVSVRDMSDTEFEQMDSFSDATLQAEWQDAGKCLDHIEMLPHEEDASVFSPQKRKLCDPVNDSDRAKRVAIESPFHEKAPFGSLVDTFVERVPSGSSREDEHVPTALSKAVIERNGERRGSRGSLPGLAGEEPLTEQRPNAKEKLDRANAREKWKLLLEDSPPSKNSHKTNTSVRFLAQCFDTLLDGHPARTDFPERLPESDRDPATPGKSNACIDLLASEKLGDEESSQDFEPPSKLPCRRKTISPLSQLELMRESRSNSPPSNESPTIKIPAFRFKLPGGLVGHHEGSSPPDREQIPGCIYSEPNSVTGKCDASDGNVVSLDSSEDDTEDSCGRQGHGSRGLEGGEPIRRLSLCLSPTSPSPESVKTDSSQSMSSQEPRDSQSIIAPSCKGILKTGTPSCKGLCKCAACSTSRSKAGTAADFISSQMKTFQLIAGRLTKEMQGLRAIIETNLSSPPETLKIQETVKKSRDVEESAEKNLTTLLRDCKRYCKLTTTKPIPMRKIVFADEAGKKLCHVKTFQSQNLAKSFLDLL